MGLIREPKNIDFIVKSEPWTEQELADFRVVMNKIKAKNARKKATAGKGRNTTPNNRFTSGGSNR